MRNKILVLFGLFLLVSMPFAAPTANAGTDKTITVLQSTNFNGASSSCSGCSIVTYNWNFGDGNSTTGVSLDHVYSSTAIYTATLTVVADTGEVSSDVATVTVTNSDSTPPTINHTAVQNWSNNTALTISAIITDNIAVSSATLYYKNNVTGTFSSASMSASGNTYSATIPAATVRNNETPVSYYISATDGTNTATNGTSTNPHNVTISGSDTIAPITSLISVSGDTSAPYWVAASGNNNAALLISGESGMSCRASPNAAYSTNWTAMGTDPQVVTCSVSGTQANCTFNASSQTTSATYYISCKDSSGNEQNLTHAVTPALNVTFGADWNAPALPLTFNMTELANGNISFNWSAPAYGSSPVSSISLLRSVGCSASNYSTLTTLSNTSTTVNDSSATVGTVYCYKLYAVDTAGNSNTSATASDPIQRGAPTISTASLTLSSGTTLALSATSGENASCRYGTTDVGYASMTTAFTSGQGTTAHSVSVAGATGANTFYTSCTDSYGNNMTTATSASYTLSAGTSTPASPSTTGGGNVGGGGSSAAQTTASYEVGGTTISLERSSSVAASGGSTTFTVTLSNSGGQLSRPFVYKETIPSRVASDPSELAFSLQPTRFETGSIIAVWEFATGLAVGESLAITYSVNKAAYGLAGFNSTIEEFSPPAPPQSQHSFIVLDVSGAGTVGTPIAIKATFEDGTPAAGVVLTITTPLRKEMQLTLDSKGAASFTPSGEGTYAYSSAAYPLQKEVKTIVNKAYIPAPAKPQAGTPQAASGQQPQAPAAAAGGIIAAVGGMLVIGIVVLIALAIIAYLMFFRKKRKG